MGVRFEEANREVLTKPVPIDRGTKFVFASRTDAVLRTLWDNRGDRAITPSAHNDKRPQSRANPLRRKVQTKAKPASLKALLNRNACD